MGTQSIGIRQIGIRRAIVGKSSSWTQQWDGVTYLVSYDSSTHTYTRKGIRVSDDNGLSYYVTDITITALGFNGIEDIDWENLSSTQLPSFWDSLISATVEEAEPTHVVLTFTHEGDLVASDLSIAGFTINSASWDGAVLTLVLSTSVVYGDSLIITLIDTSQTAEVTNNVLYSMLLASTGTGVGVNTLEMTVSSNIVVTLSANATFYSNVGGTDDPSQTWALNSGASRKIYLKCTTGTATMKFSDITKVTSWGTTSLSGWTSPANSADLTCDIDMISSLTVFKIGSGSAKNLILNGDLPNSITYLALTSTTITFTSSSALSQQLTYIWLEGNLINWTGLAISGTANITYFNLKNYRVNKMSSADMITLLTNLTNKTGTFPSTVVISDYADYASPPQAVTDAADTFKATKSISTLTLGV